MNIDTNALSGREDVADVAREGGVHLSLTGRLVYPEDDRVLRFLREGWFEYRELAMISRLLRSADWFVDIGAHCGLYSSLAARRVGAAGTIVVVEPNPILHPFIRRNVAIVRTVSNEAVTSGTVTLVNAAVATDSGEALFHVQDAGWTAYSTLQPTSGEHEARAIAVVTRPLESLLPAPKTDRPVIVKLDTEGLEYDILRHAARFLDERDDIHLMIEFDENNLASVGHTTAELRELVRRPGYTLAELDPCSFRLRPFEGDGPLWGANLVATKNLDLLNLRLATSDDDVAIETDDFLRRGAAAARLFGLSEDLDKVVDSAQRMATTIASTASVLGGGTQVEPAARPEGPAPSEARPVETIRTLEDRLARLVGAARSVAEELDVSRETAQRTQDQIFQLTSRLAEQCQAVTATRAQLTGEKGVIVPVSGTITRVKSAETAVMQARDLVDRVADEIGRLTGAARWLNEELVKQKRSLDAHIRLRAQAKEALEAVHSARQELAKLITGTARQAATGSRSAKQRISFAEAPLLEQRVKESLATAAGHLSTGLRQLAVVVPDVPAQASEDEMRAELARMKTANRSLSAEIHRLGVLVDRTRRSRWLRLGERLGADVSRQLGLIGSLIAKIEHRSAGRGPPESTPPKS